MAVGTAPIPFSFRGRRPAGPEAVRNGGLANEEGKPMKSRQLGRTGISVSPIGFGGAVIGLAGYLDSEDRDSPAFVARAEAAVRAAVDAGITYFDTAPGYGDGRSEAILGRVIEPHRNAVTLATKVGVRSGDDPSVWTDSVRASLDRLRTAQVDLVQLHGTSWPDDKAAWALGAPTEWLEEIKRAGLTRFIGVTAEVPSGGLEMMLRSGRFDVLQMAYSIIYQGACDYQRAPFGPIPLAKSLGMGVTTMRTTTSGVLARMLTREWPELDRGRISRLAIRYVLSTPEVDCALVGMSSPAEVAENAALAADEADRWDLVQLHDRYDPSWEELDAGHGATSATGPAGMRSAKALRRHLRQPR